MEKYIGRFATLMSNISWQVTLVLLPHFLWKWNNTIPCIFFSCVNCWRQSILYRSYQWKSFRYTAEVALSLGYTNGIFRFITTGFQANLLSQRLCLLRSLHLKKTSENICENFILDIFSLEKLLERMNVHNLSPLTPYNGIKLKKANSLRKTSWPTHEEQWR